jgi:hypothetical protein
LGVRFAFCAYSSLDSALTLHFFDSQFLRACGLPFAFWLLVLR